MARFVLANRTLVYLMHGMKNSYSNNHDLNLIEITALN